MTTGLALAVVATLVLDPITYDSARLWMLPPLTLALAVVYKTVKVDDIRQMPLAALLLWLTILGGMIAVAVGLHLIVWLFA